MKCFCQEKTFGDPYVECLERKTVSECTVDADCPNTLACINSRCTDPCREQNVCSKDQQCTVLNTLPLRTMICKCPPETVSDERGNCKEILREQPACTRDTDCSLDSDVCKDGNCVAACRFKQCGINAQCQSTNHHAICSCPHQYEGDAHIECRYRVIIQTHECLQDEDCAGDKVCSNNQCINPCRDQNSCGRGAFCYVERHKIHCRCPDNFNGDPNILCSPIEPTKVGCRAVSDCSKSESCINEKCINPCNCGPNAECSVTSHIPTCRCLPGFIGNPIQGCIKAGCDSDSECDQDKTCYNKECINPCLVSDPCAISATCFGQNHRSACKCLPGLQGNPFDRCERVECYSNNDCPYDHSCKNTRCVHVCRESNPCASNAICSGRDHAAQCTCPENLSDGNPYTYCYKVELEALPECKFDSDCPSQTACIDESCLNPCNKLKPCAHNARCKVLDSVPVRTMVCECEEGVLDTYGECRKLPTSKTGCESDDECSESTSCINGQCRDPCNCGIGAKCQVIRHRPICSCMEGYEGNPNIRCQTIGCRSNSECDLDKSCVNGQCLNPCLIQPNTCARNAECYVKSHEAACQCREGFKGNPLVECRAIECVSNNECPDDKQCMNEQCVNPCIYESKCAPRAECIAKNHNALCKCIQGFIGNPYVSCSPEPKLECVRDSDCSPNQLACINSKCQNPCDELKPCHNPAECQVIPSVPVRTMVCVCPDGYISSGNGHCKPIESVRVVGCVADSDCAPEKSCINAICRDPCNCGPNSECRIKEHKPVNSFKYFL
jgi:hypothetical protein